jgi:hypothetical protein
MSGVLVPGLWITAAGSGGRDHGEEGAARLLSRHVGFPKLSEEFFNLLISGFCDHFTPDTYPGELPL